MRVFYGYWQQWYGTVRYYTAGGRTIISCTKPLRGSFPPLFAFPACALFPHLRSALTIRVPEYCLGLVVLISAV
jgi:hypothetical protein